MEANFHRAINDICNSESAIVNDKKLPDKKKTKKQKVNINELVTKIALNFLREEWNLKSSQKRITRNVTLKMEPFS